MAGKSTLRVLLYGGLLGLTVGLLLVFVIFMNAFVSTKARPPEVSLEQRQRSFMALARDDWGAKQIEPDHILGHIAMVQAWTGDAEGAKQSVEKLPEFSERPSMPARRIDKNLVTNEAVHNLFYYEVPVTGNPDPAIIKRGKDLANSIQDPLLKADALRRVAEVERKVDPETAKKTLREASQTVLSVPPIEKPAMFNYWTLLWPAGLAVFGLLFALFARGLIGESASAAPAAKPKTKAEAAEEEEEEEEEEEQESDVELVGQQPALAAEMPAAPPPPPPAPAAAPAPAKTGVATGAAPAAAPPAPQPAAAMSAADKATMLAKQQAQATMLAKQAQATMLAKQQSKPTQIAPPEEANK